MRRTIDRIAPPAMPIAPCPLPPNCLDAWRAAALPGNREMEEGRMLRAMAVAALAVGVLWADVGHAQRGEPPTSPFGYAAFSLGDILLRDGVRAIDGDV